MAPPARSHASAQVQIEVRLGQVLAGNAHPRCIEWFVSTVDEQTQHPNGVLGLLAPPARLELTTLRLGGARSIQVSYGGLCLLHCTQKCPVCQPKHKRNYQHFPLHFLPALAYNITDVCVKGGTGVRESNDPNVDLDDLIFDEDDGGPSER